MSQSVPKNSTAKPTNFRFALLPALQFVTIITLGLGGLWPRLSIPLGALVHLLLDELEADVISAENNTLITHLACMPVKTVD